MKPHICQGDQVDYPNNIDIGESQGVAADLEGANSHL